MTTVKGTLLTPGVSKNNRLYTPEIVGKAYRRLSERLAAGQVPVTMLTHHAAGDDSTRIVGHLTTVALDKTGAITYEADLADATGNGATITALVQRGDLRNVSIRGCWLGPVLSKVVDGQMIETADDLEIDGVDFTKTPGVVGATVTAETTTTESAGRTVITESVPSMEFTEDAPAAPPVVEAAAPAKKAPYGDVTYADPGYQDDKKKRYPLDTKAHAKAAWSYINQKSNAALYTAAQLKRIRGRIKSALRKFGVAVTAESLAQITAEAEPLAEAATTLSECWACTNGEGTAGFSISAYNGPLTVTISAYNGIEPADLDAVAMAAMSAACDAIKAMDPDTDGDIDTGADSDETAESTNKEQEAAAVADTTEAAPPAATDPTEDTVTEQTPKTPATEDEAAVTLESLFEAVTKLSETVATIKAGDTPDGQGDAPAEENAPAEVDEAAVRAKVRAELIEDIRKSGIVARKGLIEKVNDPDKPLHEMSDEEFHAHAAKVWDAAIPQVR